MDGLVDILLNGKLGEESILEEETSGGGGTNKASS
jgi:hypothetical protein